MGKFKFCNIIHLQYVSETVVTSYVENNPTINLDNMEKFQAVAEIKGAWTATNTVRFVQLLAIACVSCHICLLCGCSNYSIFSKPIKPSPLGNAWLTNTILSDLAAKLEIVEILWQLFRLYPLFL